MHFNDNTGMFMWSKLGTRYSVYELCVSSGSCDKCQYEGHFYKVSPIMKVCHNGSILLASEMKLAGFVFHWGSKMDGVHSFVLAGCEGFYVIGGL